MKVRHCKQNLFKWYMNTCKLLPTMTITIPGVLNNLYTLNLVHSTMPISNIMHIAEGLVCSMILIIHSFHYIHNDRFGYWFVYNPSQTFASLVKGLGPIIENGPSLDESLVRGLRPIIENGHSLDESLVRGLGPIIENGHSLDESLVRGLGPIIENGHSLDESSGILISSGLIYSKDRFSQSSLQSEVTLYVSFINNVSVLSVQAKMLMQSFKWNIFISSHVSSSQVSRSLCYSKNTSKLLKLQHSSRRWLQRYSCLRRSLQC